jgi:hypothetical protein
VSEKALIKSNSLYSMQWNSSTNEGEGRNVLTDWQSDRRYRSQISFWQNERQDIMTDWVARKLLPNMQSLTAVRLWIWTYKSLLVYPWAIGTVDEWIYKCVSVSPPGFPPKYLQPLYRISTIYCAWPNQWLLWWARTFCLTVPRQTRRVWLSMEKVIKCWFFIYFWA